ncbi:hypothetical protein ACFP8W_21240, partial [Nocardioides hankookensis]
ASAGSAPGTLVRPSDLPVGPDSPAAWLDYPAAHLVRSGHDPIPLDRPGAVPSALLEASGGWLIPYTVLTGRTPPSVMVLVDDAGHTRDVARSPGLLQLVTRDGGSFVTAQRVHGHGERLTVLRQFRISDGTLLGSRRIVHQRRGHLGDLAVLQATSRRVLLERTMQVGERNRAVRYTTMWWTPATGKVDVVWQTTQDRSDTVVVRSAASLVSHTIAARDEHSGQTVRDLRTGRKLWHLPGRERAAEFSPAGDVLLTTTAPSGPNAVRVLRTRDARTGDLLATYRGTLSGRSSGWESASTYLVAGGDGIRRVEGDPVWSNPATIRCSVTTGSCERVANLPAGTSLARPTGTGY